ncbi:hypothetical protein MACH09_43380 [Vibrio sp. MACH09]|uniref:hypothetical protein n=1 Tax=Vibrio sp. MACH09 TaxID=3025122 RepID=UPI00278F8308|nr:hypothetical protein [Vibrio sp. MACH09]GLO63830.1 hypothetical protein MACH09_43380 [Vibrio sp. MACH09]
MIKPSVLFVLILCIAGYQLLTKLHSHHYDLKRSNGYHTFLKSAAAGLILFFLVSVIYAIGGHFSNMYHIKINIGEWFLVKVFPATKFSSTDGTLLEIAVWMLSISYLVPKAIYKSESEKREMYIHKFSKDPESPEFTQLFFRSLEFGLPILFTLSDRKVYIGYVIEVHASDFNDIHIVPIFSGYRERDSLELVPITPYRDVILDIEDTTQETINLEMFAVTLPLREIVHAHLHDFSYYERFKEKEDLYSKELKEREESRNFEVW